MRYNWKNLLESDLESYEAFESLWQKLMALGLSVDETFEFCGLVQATTGIKNQYIYLKGLTTRVKNQTRKISDLSIAAKHNQESLVTHLTQLSADLDSDSQRFDSQISATQNYRAIRANFYR
jgi:hypothetical protein